MVDVGHRLAWPTVVVVEAAGVVSEAGLGAGRGAGAQVVRVVGPSVAGREVVVGAGAREAAEGVGLVEAELAGGLGVVVVALLLGGEPP